MSPSRSAEEAPRARASVAARLSEVTQARAARDGYNSMVEDDDRLDFDGPNRSQKNLSNAEPRSQKKN